ncbi:MAG: hypothetical protein ACK4MQ_08165 [Hyphomonas sp.]
MIAPWMIDLVIAGMAAEFILIAAALVLTGRRTWIAPVFWFLASGALLLIAVRFALAGQESACIGTALIAAFATHILLLVTVWHRIKKPGPGSGPGRSG